MSYVKPIPESTRPIGNGRFPLDYETVKKHKSGYEIKECDTCGRKFAVNKFGDKRFYRNCCEDCTETWNRLSGLRSNKLMALYYYRVKVPRDLKGIDIGDYYHRDFSYPELDIMGRIKAYTRGMTIYQIAEELGRKPNRIYKICLRLVKKRLLRKYVSRSQRDQGRPRVKFTLTNKVVTLTKKCPKCKNNNYYLLEREKMIQCISCNLKWVIPGV